MTEALVVFITDLAARLPVMWFAFLGSIIEEIISPIPSPLVMTTIGSALAVRELVPWYLFAGTVLLATTGKIIGYGVVYKIADRIEDIVFTRFGSKIGVSHEQIENIGKMFSHTWRDDFFIFIVRFLPIMPSAPITVTAGVIKLPIVRFLTASFLGTMCRNIMYLVVGYVGLEAFTGIVTGYESSKLYIQIAVGLFLVSIIWWAVRQRKKNRFFNSDIENDAQKNPSTK
jgi:membrane protein DedA with SNARE-associated domain